LLKGEIIYKDPREKENWSEQKKESFEKALKKRQLNNNLFDYLTKNNPLIITKYAGNLDDLKIISHSTMVHYKWKCENYSECLNIFEARPRDVFRNDSKSSTKYCSICKEKNKKEQGIAYQKMILEKNGSIQTKIPDIINVWCEDNRFKSDELTDNSHKKVKLKCPNKSTKHPEYEIRVYNIQESNCVSCPKCAVKTSKAEMRIYSELKYAFKDVRWQQKIEGREADITIEDLKLVIEVDGFPWHMGKTEKDLVKNSVFEKNEHTVLRIRDSKLEKITCDNIVCNLSELSLPDFHNIVRWINNKFQFNIPIHNEWKNIDYYKEIQASVTCIPYEKSVEYLFPKSKEIWDYERNNPLMPSHFTMGSHTEIWVKCEKNHSFKRPIKQIFRIRIKDNVKRIIDCPQCSIKIK
jgi:very-short-patch-repair endonuclease